MLIKESDCHVNTHREKIRDHYRIDEAIVLAEVKSLAKMSAKSQSRVQAYASALVRSIRKEQGKSAVDALLQEYKLSTEEGIVLMCLAEALLRVPDKLTMDRLIRDKLAVGDWDSHIGNSDSLFVNASSWGLLLTGKWANIGRHVNASENEEQNKKQIGLLKKLVTRLGEPVIRTAMRQVMQVMGGQFVLGRNIDLAIDKAAIQERKGYCYSFDMLGEGARTLMDADRYFESYLDAIDSIGKTASRRGPIKGPGISVKLSAIHPRFEFSQRMRIMSELVPRLKILALRAKSYDIGFTVDAEEADRLDLSLDVIAAVFSDPELAGWQGYGLAIQAYQKRALLVVEWARELAHDVGRKMMVRLVKGAYWDSEVKWSQMDGFVDYPVFTSKAATDVSYIACAKYLLANRDVLFPQFATHNAHTVATILEIDNQQASPNREGYEFQRLHGMGESIYQQVIAEQAVGCRIYAPVGEHEDLLAYLVRRLLENGANNSFVNNIVDKAVPLESLLRDPVETVEAASGQRNQAIPLPQDIYRHSGSERSNRQNSRGFDLTDTKTLAHLSHGMDVFWGQHTASLLAQTNSITMTNPASRQETVSFLTIDNSGDVDVKLGKAYAAFPAWTARPIRERIKFLHELAEALEEHMVELVTLCIKEAGKTAADAVAEIREAVDFCRYYAASAEDLNQREQSQCLDAPKSYGVVLCISPWNFPLAIFLGQITAALVTGNTVIAKPAEQASLIAKYVVALMVGCGLPKNVVELVLGPGKPIGEKLVPDKRIAAVMFTGSTQTARWLAQALAKRCEYDVPLIAETGGQNAMIVDSTALPEQVVDDVISSGYLSAGQRCSALRVLFLQEDIADKVIELIIGAMNELTIGDPSLLSTDIGPVIDETAQARLRQHVDKISTVGTEAKVLHRCDLPGSCDAGTFFAPALIELENISMLQEEVFGPVVHVIRFGADKLARVVDDINATGFGLTLGVHSRIQSVYQAIAKSANVGNVYVNRNMIGAAVGTQPFGGRGLSGTGPKAGGPNYLERLIKSGYRLNEEGRCSDGRSAQPVHSNQAESLCGLESAIESAFESAFEKGQSVSDGDLRNAQKSWAQVSVRERISVIGEFIKVMSSNLSKRSAELKKSTQTFIEELVVVAEEICYQPLILPGPTGESNQLTYEPRGTLALVVDDTSDESVVALQMTAALLAGNAMVVVVGEHRINLINRLNLSLNGSGVPNNLVHIRPASQLETVLDKEWLTGVMSSDSSPHIKEIVEGLAGRDGALIPILPMSSPQRLLVSMMLEKCVTIDTTAAGGNAALMTM